MKVTNNKIKINIYTSLEKLRTERSFSFFQNIEYISNNKEGVIICINNESFQINNRAAYIIEHLCKLNFTSLLTYNKSVKYLSKYKYNLPLVLNKNLILVPSKAIKEYDCLWINYQQVIAFKDNYIYFESGNMINFNNTNKYWNNQVKKISEIKKLKENINI